MYVRKVASKKAVGRLYVCKIHCVLPITVNSGSERKSKKKKKKVENTEANRRGIFLYFLDFVLFNLDVVHSLGLILTPQSRG